MLNKYSWTSRKWPPKKQRFRGCLWEVVAYKIIEPQGIFSEYRYQKIYFMKENLLHAISKLP